MSKSPIGYFPREELTENRVITDVLVEGLRSLLTSPTYMYFHWEGTTGNKPPSPLMSVISITKPLYLCIYLVIAIELEVQYLDIFVVNLPSISCWCI